MYVFLITLNQEVAEVDGIISPERRLINRFHYCRILKKSTARASP
jgi:hypothetical protein